MNREVECSSCRSNWLLHTYNNCLICLRLNSLYKPAEIQFVSIKDEESKSCLEEWWESLDSDLVLSSHELGDTSSSTTSLPLRFPSAWVRTQSLNVYIFFNCQRKKRKSTGFPFFYSFGFCIEGFKVTFKCSLVHVVLNRNVVYRSLYSYRQRERVITLFPNIFFLLFLHVERVCKLFEKKEVAPLHDVAHSHSSPSRWNLTKISLESVFFRYCGKKQIECGLACCVLLSKTILGLHVTSSETREPPKLLSSSGMREG